MYSSLGSVQTCIKHHLPGGGICYNSSLPLDRKQKEDKREDNFLGALYDVRCTAAVVHQPKQSHPLQSTLTDLQALLAHHVLCLLLFLAEDSLRRARGFGEETGTANASSGGIYHYRCRSIVRHTESSACKSIAIRPTRSAAMVQLSTPKRVGGLAPYSRASPLSQREAVHVNNQD